MKNKINELINYLFAKVHEPALNCESLPDNCKAKVRNSKNLISKFKKVGDLIHYLQRFNSGHGTGNNELFQQLKLNNLLTYEDIILDITNKYKDYIDDCTKIEDFKFGETYSSYDIAILTKTYNVQAGVYLLGNAPNYDAILLKATLNGGRYPNAWLKPNKELKYYYYSIKNVFKTEYKYNQAILNSANIPIYVFIKYDTKCILNGIYKYESHFEEKNGSKWFKLVNTNSSGSEAKITTEEYNKEIESAVEESKNLSKAERHKRLNKVSEYPEAIKTISTTYKRNPDVIAEVLERANGVCEKCGNKAPFMRASNGTPYLEVHHKEQLSQGGKDTVNNALALCPNCHRKEHFGQKNSAS